MAVYNLHNRLLTCAARKGAFTGCARFAGYPRKTVDGEVSAARLDGIQQAAIATTPNNPHTAPSVSGSNAGTSYSEACNNRPAAHAPPMPTCSAHTPCKSRTSVAHHQPHHPSRHPPPAPA